MTTTNATLADAPADGRGLTTAAWFIAAVTTTFALAAIVLEIVGHGVRESNAGQAASSGGVVLVTINAVVASAFAILGAIVVSRQPRNAVGWLLVPIGFSFVCIALSFQLYRQAVLPTGDASGIAAYALWLGNWAWLPAMVPAFTFLPLLFPTGRPLGPRWRALVWFVAGATTLAIVGTAFKPGPLEGTPAVDNPLGIDHPAISIAEVVGSVSLLPAVLASITSLILRFRRSRGEEREQIKWVASAAVLLPMALLIGLAWAHNAGFSLILVALSVVAIAVAVAMLKYRLYDIDVVISRTLLEAD